MDSEVMSLRRGPSRLRRQGSNSPADRRRRSYYISEDSPASSPATASPTPEDLEPLPSSSLSRRRESKASQDYRRDSSESRTSGVSEVTDITEETTVRLRDRRNPVEIDAEDEDEDDEQEYALDDHKSEKGEPVCALCCCGEKSLLGQGDLLKFDPSPGFNPFRRTTSRNKRLYSDDTYNPHKKATINITLKRTRIPVKSRERSKSPRRANVESEAEPTDVIFICNSDELSLVGHTEEPDVQVVFEQSGHTTAHHCCAAWSDNVCQNEKFQLLNVDKAIYSGITHKCTYCKRFGATISCAEPGCGRIYHYPCAASSGSFQGIKSLVLLCPEHLELTEDIVDQEELECAICDMMGNLSESLFCTSCGQHYHANCLDPPVATSPIVRAGWQCPNCKICQTCRQPGDDNKMLVCDICDKGYHTFCLKPQMTTIPKNGWKCTNCRICSDCGTKTPGSGPSSRWHHNYSVCDSCYQQRNKGCFCPVCGKAYRNSAAQKDMLECDSCKSHIHEECEHGDIVTNYQQIKAAGHTTSYMCPNCRGQPFDEQSEAMDVEETDSKCSDATTTIQEDTIQSTLDFPMSASSVNEDSISSADTDAFSLDDPVDKKKETSTLSSLSTYSRRPHAGGGKPLDKMSQLAARYGRKKYVSVRSRRERDRDRPYPPFNRRRTRTSTTGGAKRGPRPKIKNLLPVDSSTQDSSDRQYVMEKHKDDEDDSPMHTTVVLFHTDDKFTQTQDMCISCGSFGSGPEGRLITCSQCGQCYHPYCVNIKITKVVLSKGWRCLDCTVCEGCGKNTDEARLLLCDDCDISYHTYCLDPPLHYVPKGGWKCKWCVCCQKCGATTPGNFSDWMNNYSKCGPCASLQVCPVCRCEYCTDDLICECTHCRRWLHAECDGMFSETDIERASTEKNYLCVLCRPYVPREPTPPPLPPPEPEKPPSPIKIIIREPEPVRIKIRELEGVGLTESGFRQITSLALPPIPKKKKHKSSWKSSSSGSLEILKTLADPNSEISKVADKNSDPENSNPTVVSNLGLSHDSGSLAVAMREKKKRSRSTPKPGIGGFIVRHRRSWGSKRGQRRLSSESTADETGSNKDGDEQHREGCNNSGKHEKQRRRRRPKQKSELEQKFPSYLQEAFFGKSLLDQSKKVEKVGGQSEGDNTLPSKLLEGDSDSTSVDPKKNIGEQKSESQDSATRPRSTSQDGDLGSGDDPLKFLPHKEIIDMLMGDNLDKNESGLDMHELENTNSSQPAGAATDGAAHGNNTEPIEELDSILNSNLGPMVPDDLVHMDGKEVEDLLSGVLSPSEQQQQQQHVNISQATSLPHTSNQQLLKRGIPPLHLLTPRTPGDINSPPFSPDFSEPPSPWPTTPTDTSGTAGGEETISQTQKFRMKWEKDEQRGPNATISAVLYCNINHPNLIKDYPDWNTRGKQISKLWRKVTTPDRQPYLHRARENRARLKIEEAHKLSDEIQRKRSQEGSVFSSEASTASSQTHHDSTQPQMGPTTGVSLASPAHVDMIGSNPNLQLPNQQGGRIQQLPLKPDQLPPHSPMVPTQTGSHPGFPGTPSPHPPSVHSGCSTPVQMPDRSPLQGGMDHMISGPLGPNGVPSALVDTPLPSPSHTSVPSGPTTPVSQIPGTIIPPSPFMAANVATFQTAQENMLPIDHAEVNRLGNHRSNIRELIIRNQEMQQRRNREQQGWQGEQLRPPPPPYPGNQNQAQFAANQLPGPQSVYHENSFQVPRQAYPFHGSVSPRHVSPGIVSPVGHPASMLPGDARAKQIRQTGPFIELKHHSRVPPNSRTALQLRLQQKRSFINSQLHGQLEGASSGMIDPYDQFLHHQTGQANPHTELMRQTSVPGHPVGMAHTLQRRMSLPLGAGGPHMIVPPGRSPGSAPLHIDPEHPNPATQVSRNSASRAAPSEDHEQLDELFKDGDFNILAYAASDLDTNKESEDNQQLFKAFGLHDELDQRENKEETNTDGQETSKQKDSFDEKQQSSEETSKSQMKTESQHVVNSKPSSPDKENQEKTSTSEPENKDQQSRDNPDKGNDHSKASEEGKPGSSKSPEQAKPHGEELNIISGGIKVKQEIVFETLNEILTLSENSGEPNKNNKETSQKEERNDISDDLAKTKSESFDNQKEPNSSNEDKAVVPKVEKEASDESSTSCAKTTIQDCSPGHKKVTCSGTSPSDNQATNVLSTDLKEVRNFNDKQNRGSPSLNTTQTQMRSSNTSVSVYVKDKASSTQAEAESTATVSKSAGEIQSVASIVDSLAVTEAIGSSMDGQSGSTVTLTDAQASDLIINDLIDKEKLKTNDGKLELAQDMLGEIDLEKLQELQAAARLLAKDNPTMQNTAGNLTSDYLPNQEAESDKKHPGPHARLLQAMNIHHQMAQQHGRVQGQIPRPGFAPESIPQDIFANQEVMETDMIGGPRSVPTPSVNGPFRPQDSMIMPQQVQPPQHSPLQQMTMNQMVRTPMQSPVNQMGMMVMNQGMTSQVPDQGQMVHPSMMSPGQPRMPGSVTHNAQRMRAPLMSQGGPSLHPRMTNYHISERFQRMPNASPHLTGLRFAGSQDSPAPPFSGFDPYDNTEEPAPDQSHSEEYQDWLYRREQLLQMRVKFFEAEVGKERKKKKVPTATLR